jgi:PIN domain nuclease of toxin-antitoxin system
VRLLLDTHVLLWAWRDPARLSTTARELIEDASVELLVSAASAWEIATKHRLGKLPDASPIVLSYTRNLDRLGAHELPISSRHALAAGDLGWEHRDPFDRMLAAQSILDGLPLVTSDAAFGSLGGLHRVW